MLLDLVVKHFISVIPVCLERHYQNKPSDRLCLSVKNLCLTKVLVQQSHRLPHSSLLEWLQTQN